MFRLRFFRPLISSLAAACVLLAGPAAAAGATPQARVIVKLKAEANQTTERAAERLERMAVRHGAQAQAQRPLGGEVRLLKASGMDSATLAKRLAADPDVAYAVPDRRMRRNAVPNDPLYGFSAGGDPEVGQWYLRPPDSLFVSAIDAQRAWDTTRGSSAVVVAVLDTGVRFDHPDLKRVAGGGKLLPGYDFIRDRATAGDRDGTSEASRDPDPSDPGDFVTQADLDGGLDEFDDCDVTATSSWHGTQVAGLIGALTDNGVGVAGAAWNTRLLPVRVLGKCGGFESDIVAAMRWAAGMSIQGVPDNPVANRARVINLSLGGSGACGAAYRDAVADVTARGVAVVASAGNTAGHEVSAPANCEGVIGVAGLRHLGTKVGFSDLGREVSISAPGGNCVFTEPSEPCLFPLITTTNAGATTPVAANAAYTNGSDDVTAGTSFSAPLVSGAAALVLAVRPELAPDELRDLLRSTARPFPTSGAEPGVPQCTAPRSTASGQPIDQLECYCTTETCGAGMLDARAAVLTAADAVVARIALVGSEDPRAGKQLTLSVSDSLLADGRSIAAVRWTLVDDGGIVDGFDGPTDQPTVMLTPVAGGSFTVRALVTDSSGAESTQAVRVRVEGDRRDDGGGGGALGAGYLLALLAALGAVRRAVRRGPAR